MPSLLPTPEPADPVEGQPGHFEHSNWLKASVKALDSGVVHKSGDTMTGDLSVTRGAGDGLLKAGARAGGAAIFATAVPESVAPGSLTIWATKLLLWNGAETPTDANSAATKGYVDTAVQAGITVSDVNGLKRITFATPFDQTPAITLTADEYMKTPLFAQIRRSEPTYFEFSVEDKDGAYVAVNTHWVARRTTQ